MLGHTIRLEQPTVGFHVRVDTELSNLIQHQVTEQLKFISISISTPNPWKRLSNALLNVSPIQHDINTPIQTTVINKYNIIYIR